MGQGERIGSVTHCPLTPSLKRSLKPQGIKKSLNLHFRHTPILVTVSLALILMGIGLVIFWTWVPVDWLPTIHGFGHPGFYLFILWNLVVTLAAVLIVRILRPNLFDPPLLGEVSLAFILMIGGLVIFWMVMQNEKHDGSLGILVSILLGT
ncbi:MAG: hypothetical protein ACXACD_18295 [Candidatus Thorarchaeota archaeon]|jgi:hypothetical protein